MLYMSLYSHLRLEKAPRRVPCPMVGHLKHSLFGLAQPKSEGHHVLSQLFDWQRFIYHIFPAQMGRGKIQWGAFTSRRWVCSPISNQRDTSVDTARGFIQATLNLMTGTKLP